MAGVKIIDQALNTTGNASLGGDLKVVGTASGLKREVIRQSADSDTAITLTTQQSGALILLDEDEAYTITLPAITADDIGTTYEILESVASDNLRSVVTAYDNDYYVGGVTNTFDAAKTDGSTGGIAFLTAGGTDTTIKFDDDLANGGGGVGSRVVLTAVLTGNTGAGGGTKLVWAVSGNKIMQAETDTGAAFFA
jgi:hypothetical protein